MHGNCLSVPGVRKIRGNAWYTLFAHVWLPGFSGELGNYCICLCAARLYIIGWLGSSHVMSSSGKDITSTNPLCNVAKPAMVLNDEQTLAYTVSPLFFITAGRNILLKSLGRSSNSPWIVNKSLACLASTLERQKRHSKVVTITHCWLCSILVPVPNMCYYLQCWHKYQDEFYGIIFWNSSCMCKQCVPGTPIFWVPGNKATVSDKSPVFTATVHAYSFPQFSFTRE